MFDDYVEEYEASCPKCGHFPLRRRDCDNIGCDEGYFDEADEDPINFMPGESYLKCSECKGTGCVIWCPECGTDWTGHKFPEDEDFE